MAEAKLPPEHFRSLAALEDHYWWHQARYLVVWDLLQRHLPRPAEAAAADVGCGTGGLLRFLQRKGMSRLLGCDYSEPTLDSLCTAGIRVVRSDLEEPFILPDQPYDVLTALDVMEHLADEKSFLKSALASLRPGGLLIVTVPAHPSLFSEWDRRLRHFRRYSTQRLATELGTAGFTVREISHFFSFVMPMALVRRWFGAYDGSEACEFPPVAPTLNRTLLILAALERRLLRKFSSPIGTSLYALAQTPLR